MYDDVTNETQIDQEDDLKNEPSQEENEEQHSDNEIVTLTVEQKRAKKHEKFREIAERRVDNIAKSISVLGNLSNTNTYAYSQTEVDVMFDHIQSVLDKTRAQFATKRNADNGRFSFGELETEN